MVVTGAGQGIGRSVALAMCSAGAAVAVADLNDAAAAAVADEIRGRGGRVVARKTDVTEEDQVSALAETTEAMLGKVSCWVNNAGLVRPAMLHKMELADFDVVMRVHVRGTFIGTREAARRMIASGTQGVILNLASSAGLQGTIGQINYAGAKGAIVSMTKSAAKELARHGIRANCVAPVAATPMTEKIRTDPKLSEAFLGSIPLRRFADPSEVAETFVFLASPSAAYITGQVICVDGGLYMAS